MEPVLIYTNKSFVDRGAIQTFSMDLAFGADEQDFEIEFSEPSLSGGELLYIDGTEYGGIIDEITHSTETDNVIYKGRTWHGMLAGKIVKPPSGSNYYTLSGDANACIRSLLSKVGLYTILTGRTTSAGISVNYQFERFCNAYDGLLKMLASANAVLRIERHDGITELWAEPRTTITDEADSDLMDFAITDSYRVPNHLVCAGEGELQDRVVVDLYADSSGNVSQTQTLTGVNEIAVLYNYNNADAAELIAEGTKELQSYQLGGGADLQVNNKGDWHVGDLIRVRDNRSGTVITSTINKKIVKVSNGVLSVDYEVGVASAQSYGGGASAETNLVTPIANGGTGATTAADAASNLNVLPLTGGVMNGGVVIKDVAFDRNGANPSSMVFGQRMFAYRDKDNDTIGYVQPMRDTSGNIGISLNAVNGDSSNNSVYGGIRLFVDKSSNVTYTVSSPANFRSAIGAAASSDRRLKTDVEPLGADAIEFVKNLEPCVYTINGEQQVGFIAQDVADIDPWGTRMAFETRDGIDGLDKWETMPDGSPTWKLDYIRTIPPIAAALKQAIERIGELEKRVSELESRQT